MIAFYEDPFDRIVQDPFVCYNQPRCAQCHHKHPFIKAENYISAVEHRLNQVLAEEFGIRHQDYPKIDIQERARQLAKLQRQDEKDCSETKQKIEKEALEAENNAPFKSYINQHEASFEGNLYIEEHREKVVETDGKIHSITRRRLGDRWYTAEAITDKDGKTSSKETWHNVPEDKMESFKIEWGLRHNEKQEALKQEEPKPAAK